jgi:hypothetical protein
MTCKMRLAIELGSGLEPGLEVFYPGQATALLMSKMSKPLHRPYKFVLCGNRQVFIFRRPQNGRQLDFWRQDSVLKSRLLNLPLQFSRNFEGMIGLKFPFGTARGLYSELNVRPLAVDGMVFYKALTRFSRLSREAGSCKMFCRLVEGVSYPRAQCTSHKHD